MSLLAIENFEFLFKASIDASLSSSGQSSALSSSFSATGLIEFLYCDEFFFAKAFCMFDFSANCDNTAPDILR